MPDALSKTVPIWCAVINRSVAKGKPWGELHFPNTCVSVQEISSIEALIPSFVQSFKVGLLLLLFVTVALRC
jgi:tRNA A64-2'-O-ribosylphosphate transferase